MQNLFIVWNDVHKTGIKIIDEQHRGVVTAINSLYYFMQHNRGSIVVVPIFDIIEKYTQIHFLTEEAMLEQADYPAFSEHKKYHVSFVTSMRKNVAAANYDPQELLVFLKSWWLDHINKKDKDYVPFVLKAMEASPGSFR